jgi:alpha-L-fucosidase
LWNDIDWPDAGKRTGRWSLHELFTDFYSANPDGVVNDRWGDTHWDFRTSEYEAGAENESAPGWENCRGIGFSFGYNQVEGETETLSGRQLAAHLCDVVSRGGRLLLNVGPTAEGDIPPLQQASLRSLGRWMATAGEVLRSSRPVSSDLAEPGSRPWVRWLETPEHLVAMVGQPGVTPLFFRTDVADVASAEVLGGAGRTVGGAGSLSVQIDAPGEGPALVLIPKRR